MMDLRPPSLLGFIGMVLIAALALTLTSCTSSRVVVQYRCPPLSDPPSSTMDALESAGRKDPSSAAWVIDLDRHYTKCDLINKQGGKT